MDDFEGLDDAQVLAVAVSAHQARTDAARAFNRAMAELDRRTLARALARLEGG